MRHPLIQIRLPLAVLFIYAVGNCAILQAQPPISVIAPTANAVEIKPKDYDELWYGVIKTDIQWLRNPVYLKKEADGRWSGYMVSLDQRAARIPFSSIVRSDEKLTLEATSVGGKFEGTLIAGDVPTYTGTFFQRGSTFPYSLTRVDKLPPMEGDEVWRGELNAILAKLQMQLRIVQGDREKSKLVLVDSLSEGVSSLVGSLEEQDGKVTISVPGIKAKWRGSRSEDGKTMEGLWSQGLIPLSLTWRKETQAVEPTVSQAARPQTPKPPFPYEIREAAWDNAEAKNVRLAGTLVVPKSLRPVPAAVLITGSGPQDRDESIANHKPFWVMADHLARQGIAVLRYDDRGVGKSTGDFSQAVTDDFVSDARSAWLWLSQQPGIDARRIGLIGHSEGAAFATAVAATNELVAYVVMLAGAAWDGKRTVVEQSLEMARRQGESEEKLKALETFTIALCDLMLRDDGTTSIKPAISKIVSDYIQAIRIPEEQRGSVTDALEKQLTQLNSPWYRDFLKRDPTEPLKAMRQPMLALWGSEDVQVLAEGNRQSLQAALESSASSAVRKLVVIPGLNHLFQPCTTGLLVEYGTIETTLAPEVLEQVAGFIKEATTL